MNSSSSSTRTPAPNTLTAWSGSTTLTLGTPLAQASSKVFGNPSAPEVWANSVAPAMRSGTRAGATKPVSSMLDRPSISARNAR